MHSPTIQTGSSEAVSRTAQQVPQGQPSNITRSSSPEITPLPGSSTAVASPSNVPPTPPANQKHILVISGGMGGGHTSPMDAVHHHLRGYGDVRVTYERNVRVAPFPRNCIDDIRYRISNNKLGAIIATKWREVYSQRGTYRTINSLIQRERPDYVFVNHRILGQAVAKHLPIGTPMALATTDHGKMHVGWYPTRFNKAQSRDTLIVPNADGERHAGRYMPQARIQNLGYPVREAFERLGNVPKEEVRRELGLPLDKRVVVMSGGSGHWGDLFVGLASRLLNDPRAENVHLVAVAGASESLKTRLDALKADLEARGGSVSFEVHGLCDQEKMAKLVRASDINATKAGGASLGESYALGSVPVIYQMLSGVERDNVRHVLQNNTGLVALQPRAFIDAVFNTRVEDLETMRQNQANFPTHGGAARIAAFLREQALATETAPRTSTESVRSNSPRQPLLSPAFA